MKVIGWDLSWFNGLIIDLYLVSSRRISQLRWWVFTWFRNVLLVLKNNFSKILTFLANFRPSGKNQHKFTFEIIKGGQIDSSQIIVNYYGFYWIESLFISSLFFNLNFIIIVG
jgi:hypothetical protein